jgi:hypothetical protein
MRALLPLALLVAVLSMLDTEAFVPTKTKVSSTERGLFRPSRIKQETNDSSSDAKINKPFVFLLGRPQHDWTTGQKIRKEQRKNHNWITTSSKKPMIKTPNNTAKAADQKDICLP